MRVFIKTKSKEEYQKEVLVTEEEFLEDLWHSVWLKIENTNQVIYLKISEIERLIFIKE